jgi:hypothetical protein
MWMHLTISISDNPLSNKIAILAKIVSFGTGALFWLLIMFGETSILGVHVWPSVGTV